MEPLIFVRDLHRSHKDVRAVGGVSFEVERGEVFALVGPNGAGKTTTLETMESLRSVQRGQGIVDGIDLARDPGPQKSTPPQA